MVKQRDFLLESSGVVSNRVLFADILAIGKAALDVIKVIRVWIQHNFGGVIEEDTD